MIRWVVTGGAGFIGSHFIDLLITKEPTAEIICIDALTYAGNMENLSQAMKHSQFHFYHERIENTECMQRILKPGDVVVNFAAETHVDRSITEPAHFIETNIKGVFSLIELSHKIGIRRFVQISTDEVYGDLQLSDPPFTEESPIRPSNPYSASKASGDLLVQAFARTYCLNSIITRCGNNFGQRQHPEKFLPKMLARARAQQKLPIFGNGHNIRDWVYVGDHCLGIYLATTRGQPGEVFNFGGGNEHSNIDLARAIIEYSSGRSDQLDFVADRPGHDFRYALNSTKAAQVLGWRPTGPSVLDFIKDALV